MNRRSLLMTLLTSIGAQICASLQADDLRVSHPGGTLDKWLHGPTATKAKSSAGRVMKWACVCLRRGAHWTIGAISFAAASIGQVRHHLVSVHGHSYSELNGMSKEQLGRLHDNHHEGRSYRHYSIPKTPPNGVNHLAANCPTGY